MHLPPVSGLARRRRPCVERGRSTLTALAALLAGSGGNLWAARYDGASWVVTTPALEPTLSSTASVPFAGSLRD